MVSSRMQPRYRIRPRELAVRRRRVRVIIKRLNELFPDAGMMLRYRSRWELLVAVMLSAQCTDVMVNKVTKKLFQKYRTLDDYARADITEFERDIRSTGFYRAKARNIIQVAKQIKTRHGGRVPRTMQELTALPGVARKTANVVLGNAFGIVEGIAVDTHVKRLAHRLGLTNETNPVAIERDLMQIVPKKDWFRFTYLLIEYGRRYCTARSHDHARCPLKRFDR